MPQGAFQEAERQFRWYTDEYHGGRLDQASYRSAIDQLRVTDAQGRQWIQQEGSGRWHVWTGAQWQPATPPYQPTAPAAPPPPAQATPQVRRPTTAAPEVSTSGCLGKVLLYWLGAIVLFALIGGALMLFVEDFPLEGLGGVALAAVISMIITAVSLSKRWEGEVIEIYQKRVRVSGDDDEPDHWEHVRMARIRQPSGKEREERAMPDWRVGDYLRKQRGQMHIEKLNG